MLKSFRELDVWQRSMQLVQLIYQETDSMPKTELYGITSQIRRAVVSIPTNIAEGYGRKGRGEYIYFLSIANASLMELETLTELARNLGYLGNNTKIVESCSTIGKMLTKLIQSLQENKRAPS